MEKMTISLPDGWKATIEQAAEKRGFGPSELIRRELENWVTATLPRELARRYPEDSA